MKNSKVKLILSSILLFHLINNYIWLTLDKSYLLYDGFSHHLHSLQIYNILKEIFHLNFFIPWHAIFRTDTWYGPFVSFVTAPFYFIFGKTQDAGVMINSTIFLSILIFSTYGIAKRLFNEKAGLLAAFVVTMYPIVFNHLRTYMLDLPLTAMAALTIYLLIRSDDFKNKKYSLLLQLNWQVELLTEKNMELNDVQVGFCLRKDYKTWLNLYTQGHMPALLPWQSYADARSKEPSCFIGLNLTKTKEGLLPAVLLDLSQDQPLNLPLVQVIKVIDTKSVYAYSVLSVSAPKRRILFAQGSNILFSGRPLLFTQQPDVNHYIKEKTNTLFYRRG